MLGKALGESVRREEVEALIQAAEPDRFSPATLKSIAQNINGSWTQSTMTRLHTPVPILKFT